MITAHIFIKPTGVERGEDPYEIRRGLFRPEPADLQKACEDWLGSPLRRFENRITDRARDLAGKNDINILGGAFLAGLEVLGFRHTPHRRFSIDCKRGAKFIGALYPDLAIPNRGNLPKIANNTGCYSIHAVQGQQAKDLHQSLSEIKRGFRTSLVKHITLVEQSSVRDHVVHVPNDPLEDLRHRRAALHYMIGCI